MSTITEPNEYTIEGIVGTDSGNQRVVMTEEFSGTQLTHTTDSVEVVCEDGQGHKQRCVAVTHFSDSESSPIPSQTGHGGQFLKTTGSTLVWDNALQNSATGQLALSVDGEATGDGSISLGIGSEAGGSSGITIGVGAEGSGDDSVLVGGATSDNGKDYNTIVGGRAEASDNSNVVLGYNAKSTAAGSVALGYQAEATENGTFVVGLSSDGITTTNYTVIDTDGKINPAMFANVPTADGNYVLRVTVNNGEKTYSWVAE